VAISADLAPQALATYNAPVVPCPSGLWRAESGEASDEGGRPMGRILSVRTYVSAETLEWYPGDRPAATRVGEHRSIAVGNPRLPIDMFHEVVAFGLFVEQLNDGFVGTHGHMVPHRAFLSVFILHDAGTQIAKHLRYVLRCAH
jgi:hypothetical protein